MRQWFRVKGHVQGIGYRFFVVQAAQKLSLTGWVRNCSNGDVECEAQGGERSLESFLASLESGHPWARVEKVDLEPLPEKTDEKGFEIQV